MTDETNEQVLLPLYIEETRWYSQYGTLWELDFYDTEHLVNSINDGKVYSKTTRKPNPIILDVVDAIFDCRYEVGRPHELCAQVIRKMTGCTVEEAQLFTREMDYH